MCSFNWCSQPKSSSSIGSLANFKLLNELAKIFRNPRLFKSDILPISVGYLLLNAPQRPVIIKIDWKQITGACSQTTSHIDGIKVELRFLEKNKKKQSQAARQDSIVVDTNLIFWLTCLQTRVFFCALITWIERSQNMELISGRLLGSNRCWMFNNQLQMLVINGSSCS